MNSTDRTSEIVETGKLKDKTTKKRKSEAMKDKIITSRQDYSTTNNCTTSFVITRQNRNSNKMS